ncbi:MAG: hypothetical protein K2J12_01845, partial [Muribaculaceae bacterium]|nr:hypothetical protein [Muribaculaceae bacterium]
MKKTLLSLIIALGLTSAIYASDRWSILPDSSVIAMSVTKDRLPHADHVEMSGKKMAVVLYWDLDSSSVFELNRALVFPMLRTIPNDTHASLMLNNDVDVASMLRINGRKVSPITKSVELNGMMKVVSDYITPDGASVELSRTIFPTMEHPAMIELYTARNNGDKNVTLLVPELKQTYTTDAAKGVDGAYVIQSDVNGAGAITLQPGETADFSLIIQAYKANGDTPLELNATEELAERLAFIDIIDNNLILNTPDKAIDTEFRYAKIRGAESIYKTKGGYMHGPGGESYYAALWCNDQAEYINPFFPFLGYDVGNESALNCFRHYARFINDEYKPIPSSIIAEGDDIWNGAGDRGDAAMLAYGASRYALAHGDKVES